MSPLYPCGKPCSTGTHNETMKKLTLFLSAFICRIMMESRPLNIESRPRISSECCPFFNRIESSITFAVAIVIHKSCNLIGTLGRSEFGPK